MPVPAASPVPAHVAEAFGVVANGVLLPGGEERTFRCGDFVLRRESKNIAEMPDALFGADLFSRIGASPEFRVPRPQRARDGSWLHHDWSCWSFVEGRWATAAEAPEMVRAIEAFHRAISDEPCPPYLPARALVYDRADRAAFGDMPADVDDRVRATLIELYALRRPLDPELRNQLIHGDANAANILIAPGLPPAIIDFAPYWRPPEFALAVTALWLCGYQRRRGIPRVRAHPRLRPAPAARANPHAARDGRLRRCSRPGRVRAVYRDRRWPRGTLALKGGCGRDVCAGARGPLRRRTPVRAGRAAAIPRRDSSALAPARSDSPATWRCTALRRRTSTP